MGVIFSGVRFRRAALFDFSIYELSAEFGFATRHASAAPRLLALVWKDFLPSRAPVTCERIEARSVALERIASRAQRTAAPILGPGLRALASSGPAPDCKAARHQSARLRDREGRVQ